MIDFEEFAKQNGCDKDCRLSNCYECPYFKMWKELLNNTDK